MALLRDRTGTTRLLILGRLEGRPGITLSDVAVELGITVQAVSAHTKQMAALGLVSSADGVFRATPAGRQALHEGVRRLRDEVTALADPLEVIQVTSAVAAQHIRAGAAVGLWMSDGDLEARAGPSANTAPSHGRAVNDALPGGEVRVGELKGMVRLVPGQLTVITVPGPAEGGIERVDRAKLARRLGAIRSAKWGAHGTGARILARSLVGNGIARLDFEYAADVAAFNAAERGLDAALLVSRDRLPDVMQAFERLNGRTIRRVPIEQVEAPERHA